MTNSIAEALAKAERERLAKLAREQMLQGALSSWGGEQQKPPAPQPATTPQENMMATQTTSSAPAPTTAPTPAPAVPPGPMGVTPAPTAPPATAHPYETRKIKWWADEDATLSELIFYTIRDNPGVHRLQLIKELGDKGHNRNSVSALIAQMRRGRMLRESAEGYLTTILVKYRPAKTSAAYKKSMEQYHKQRSEHPSERQPRRVSKGDIKDAEKLEQTLDTGVGRTDPTGSQTTPAPSQAVDIRSMTAQDIVSAMSFVQARDVRRMLNNMFAEE